MICLGKGGERKIGDYQLSRFACEGIQHQQKAIRAHGQVGKEVREAIQRIGGELPENIPPAEHIKQVEKRVKGAAPKIELDKHDAGGLLGKSGNS